MKNTAVIGAQWGDEGKGKICNCLSEKFDVIARFAGGNNAGHTVVIGDKTYKLHHIPSGIFHPGKINLLGAGMVIDLEVLLGEIEKLQENGITCQNLRIAENAHLIMPHHRLADGAQETKREDKLGTTRRGIGPAYTDRVARIGIMAGDLLYPEIFRKKLQRQLENWRPFLAGQEIDEEAIYSRYLSMAPKIKSYLVEGSKLLEETMKQGKSVLFEGAQGVLLDVFWGTYPYVTSSSCIAGNASVGLGVDPRKVERIVGVAKAYTTRVGTGPFPTEDESIAKHLLEAGAEYGTTTGRPRRCSWLDLVLLNFSRRVSGIDSFALTKIDVLSRIEKIKVCTEYEIDGKRTKNFPTLEAEQEKCKPIYTVLDGWSEDITGAKSLSQLPKNARTYIEFIEEYTGVPVEIVSVGPGYSQVIYR